MKNKKVAINSVVYTVSNLILKMSSFLLLPLYTVFLTPEDYGVINLSNSFVNVATYVFAFSIYSAVMRFYADVKENTKAVKELYSTSILFVSFSGLFFSLVLFFLKYTLAKTIFKGISVYPTIILIITSAAFHCFYVLYQDILKAKQDSIRSAITSICYFLLQIILNIYFVVGHNAGATGVLLSGVICNCLGTIWMFVDLMAQKIIGLKFNLSLLKSMLKYSIPLMPHNLSTSIAELTSRIFLNGKGSLSTVGVYGISSQFGSVADTIQSSTNSAFEPWFYGKMKEKTEQSRNEIIRLTNDIIWAFGFIAVCLSLFSQEAVYIMTTSAYDSVWKYVPFLVAVYVIKIPYYFYVCILYYNKDATKYIFVATLGASLLNIFLSYNLIAHFDIYGSILSDIFAMIFRVIIIIYLANRTEKIGFRVMSFLWRIFTVICCIFIGIIPSYLWFSQETNVLNFLYKVVIIFIYVIIAGKNLLNIHNMKWKDILHIKLNMRRK